MIKNISKWRWVILAVLLFGSASEGLYFLSYGNVVPPSIFEVIITQTNTEITFTLMLIFLLISGDISYGSQTQGKLMKLSPAGKALYFLRTAVVVSLLFFGILVVMSIIASFLYTGFTLDFINRWKTVRDIPHIFTPFLAVGISLMLVFFRFLFLALIIQAINSKSKHPLGFIGAIVVCLIEAFVYFNLRIVDSTGLLPFEHSYLDSVIKLSPDVHMNIIYSVLYWLLLIIALLAIMIFINRTPKNKIKAVAYERFNNK